MVREEKEVACERRVEGRVFVSYVLALFSFFFFFFPLMLMRGFFLGVGILSEAFF